MLPSARWLFLTFVSSLVIFALTAVAVLALRVVPGDVEIIQALRVTHTLSRTLILKTFTNLGSPPVLAGLTVIALVVLLGMRRFGAATLTFVAVAGAVALNTALKQVFQRVLTLPPPSQPAPHGPPASAYDGVIGTPSLGLELKAYAFPSGHATGITTLLLVLALLVPGRWRPWAVSVAGALSFLVGYSRLYFAAHYPTDVLGSWAVAVAWVSFCCLVWSRLDSAVRHGAESGFHPHT